MVHYMRHQGWWAAHKQACRFPSNAHEPGWAGHALNSSAILKDESGYADAEFQAFQHFTTRGIDRRATAGLRSTIGFVSRSCRSPSSLGLPKERHTPRLVQLSDSKFRTDEGNAPSGWLLSDPPANAD